MSKKVALSLLALLAIMLLPSCGRHASTGKEPIPYVSQIILDKSCPEYELISSFDSDNPYGNISIIGTPERCLPIAARFMNCDDHDNIDGSCTPDFLPDFAGEEIYSVVDSANTPYTDYLQGDKVLELRKLAVMHALTAIDTTCIIASYNSESYKGSKMPAKIIVLASPYMAAYGMYDVDTLFHAFGKDVPVICPATEMISSAIAAGKHDIGILTDSTALRTGVYKTIIEDLLTQAQASEMRFTQYVYDRRSPQKDVLKNILDQRRDSGNDHPMDMLLVDDFLINTTAMSATLDTLKSERNGESFSYNRLISDDFQIVNGMKAVTDKCYKLMRDRNIFTHNIVFPRAANYVTVRLDDGTFSLAVEGHRFSRHHEASMPPVDSNIVESADSAMARDSAASLKHASEVAGPKEVADNEKN